MQYVRHDHCGLPPGERIPGTIHAEVIRALQDGRLQDIEEMDIKSGVYRVGQKTLVLVDDGTALAWAPSKEQLRPDMFDGASAGERAPAAVAMT